MVGVAVLEAATIGEAEAVAMSMLVRVSAVCMVRCAGCEGCVMCYV